MALVMNSLSLTPARDSVGGALRFVRHAWRRSAVIALVGAAAVTALTLAALALGESHVPLGLLLGILNTVLLSGVYAALIGAALHPEARPLARLAPDTARVWAA